MRIFQRYNPLKVAKYVKTLFRGRLYIKDVGAFEFDEGKILPPKIRDKRHFSVMSEVNRRAAVAGRVWLNTTLTAIKCGPDGAADVFAGWRQAAGVSSGLSAVPPPVCRSAG